MLCCYLDAAPIPGEPEARCRRTLTWWRTGLKRVKNAIAAKRGASYQTQPPEHCSQQTKTMKPHCQSVTRVILESSELSTRELTHRFLCRRRWSVLINRGHIAGDVCIHHTVVSERYCSISRPDTLYMRCLPRHQLVIPTSLRSGCISLLCIDDTTKAYGRAHAAIMATHRIILG